MILACNWGIASELPVSVCGQGPPHELGLLITLKAPHKPFAHVGVLCWAISSKEYRPRDRVATEHVADGRLDPMD